MNSILIKGMEMPHNCWECPFLDYEEESCLASGVKYDNIRYQPTVYPGRIEDGSIKTVLLRKYLHHMGI